MRSLVNQKTVSQQNSNALSALQKKKPAAKEQSPASHSGLNFDNKKQSTSGEDNGLPASNTGGHNFSKILILPTSPVRVQPKLKINAPGDKYEQEADKVAEQVMRMPDAGIGNISSGKSQIQLKCAACESGGSTCPKCAEKAQTIQAKESPGSTPKVTPQIGANINTLKGGGQALPQATRRFFEPRFGADFRGVRLHTNTLAEQTSRMVNARAFTIGQNIVFGSGQYSPDSVSGKKLLAHELTHVVQQSGFNQPALQRLALGLDYEYLAKKIEKAVWGPGTDEEAIFQALSQLQRDSESVAELEKTYKRLFSNSLVGDLISDLSSDEWDFAKGLMGKTVSKDSKHKIEATAPATATGWAKLAERIKKAVDHKSFWFFGGTDEEAIFAVLQPLAGNADHIASLKKAYAKFTGRSESALEEDIRDEMSGSELSYALNLLKVPDPHAGTQPELSQGQVVGIRNELLPGTKVTPPPPPATGSTAPVSIPPPALWDGRAGAPNEAANKAALKADLMTALTNHLGRVIGPVKSLAGADKIPIKKLEGAANAAVEVTDDEYKSSYSVAASTPSQSALRSGFKFSNTGGNLLDATSPADRAASGAPLSAASVTFWMIKNDAPPKGTKGTTDYMRDHNFNPSTNLHGEQTWLISNVINPFIAPPARNADLVLFDQYAFALQPKPGIIVVPTTAPGSGLAKGGAANLVDRRKMWSIWHVAVHEYLHNLVHPAFRKAYKGSVMREGFTEYFTKGVITKVAPVAHQNSSLVRKVEDGIHSPATTPAIVGPYATPKTYAKNLANVENIAKIIPGGDNALRAAYFQGHVEMLGIDPTTSQFLTSAPGTVDPSLVNVPAGISNLEDLAKRSGVSKSTILSSNSALSAKGPLPAKLKLPGTREHKIAATFTAIATGPTETVDQIAKQNGVSIEALKAANPGVTWGSLSLGQTVLIPKH